MLFRSGIGQCDMERNEGAGSFSRSVNWGLVKSVNSVTFSV